MAWAHARAGEPDACERALGRVENAYADRNPDEEPVWVYWLSTTEIQVMAGRCWTELGRPLRAVPALEKATASYRADLVRESALYLTWLAVAYLQAAEIDQAAYTATRALGLARQVNSARGTARTEHLGQLLTPYRGTPSVDTFEDLRRSP